MLKFTFPKLLLDVAFIGINPSRWLIIKLIVSPESRRRFEIFRRWSDGHCLVSDIPAPTVTPYDGLPSLRVA